MRRTTTKLLALGTAAALGLAACGDDEVTPAQSGVAAPVADETTTTADDAPAESADDAVEPTTDDAASTLRAELAAGLQEHVYLMGMALETALDAGTDEDDAATTAALQAVDDSAVALSEVIGSVPGGDADAFLELWREHVDLLIEHARGSAGGSDDDAAAEEGDTAAEETTDGETTDEAPAGFEDFQQAVADHLEELTDGELVADDLFGELEIHMTSMTDTVDALADDDREALTLLRDAAGHMSSLAATISTGIVAAHPDAYQGDPASVPAETRAELTTALVEHAYLAGIAAEQVVEANGAAEDPAVQAAVVAVDANTVDLANTVGSAAGNDQRRAFLDLWRQHADAIVAHTAGRAGDGQAAADQAMAELDSFPAAAGAFFEDATAGATTAGDLEAGLSAHIDTITAAIEALVAGDPGAFSELREAGQQLTETAAALARAIVAADDADQGGQTETTADEGDQDGATDVTTEQADGGTGS